jgi:hypothetical protein
LSVCLDVIILQPSQTTGTPALLLVPLTRQELFHNFQANIAKVIEIIIISSLEIDQKTIYWFFHKI